MKDKEKEKGEVSRRDFLVAAGAIVAGGAIGAGITYPLMAGKTETVEVTKTVETTKTVQVPTTITSTEPGTTVTSTAPGTTITSTAPGTTVTVTGPPPVEIKETKYSLCPGCFYSCTMEFTLVNGVVTEMRGNRDLPVMGEAGGVCGKGLAAFDRVYNPSRLLYPLKRVGKRGEGKHRRITWDEALTEIAGKLKEYRDQGHPEYACFQYGCPRQVRARDIYVWVAKKYGTPYSVMRWHGQACNTSGSMAQTMTGNTLLGGTPDYENAKSGVLFAHEDSAGRPGVPQVSVLMSKGIRNEYKCYLVDPRMSTDAILGNNEWIPIRPNTDVALWLALLNVIIKEKMYDEERLINYSNAPFLVRDDNGLILKDSDDSELVWDTVSDSAQPADKEGVVPALIGARTVDGVSCKTAFDLLTERTEKYPPDVAAEICDMPKGGAKITEMARHMGNARPAVMTTSYVPSGNGYQGSIQSWRCNWILSMLMGNKDRKGGLLGMKGSSTLGPTPPDWEPYPRPATLEGGAIEGWGVQCVGWDADLYPLADSNQIRYSAFHEAVVNGNPHPIKMMLSSASNFIVTSRNMMEDIFKNLELLVSNDTNPVEATDWADIVLPDCTTYEMLYTLSQSGPYYPGIVTCNEILKPPGECRPWGEVLLDIGRRVGLDGCDITPKEYWQHEVLDRYSLTYEEDFAKGEYHNWDGVIEYEKQTLKGRSMIYSVPMAEKYHNPDHPYYHLANVDPIPEFEDTVKRELGPDEFRFASGKSVLNSHSQSINDRLLCEDYVEGLLARQKVWLNPVRAAALGIKDGDWVDFRGEEGGGGPIEAKVTECIHPSTAFVWFGYGSQAKHTAVQPQKGLNPNNFLKYYEEPLSGAFCRCQQIIKISKLEVQNG